MHIDEYDWHLRRRGYHPEKTAKEWLRRIASAVFNMVGEIPRVKQELYLTKDAPGEVYKDEIDGRWHVRVPTYGGVVHIEMYMEEPLQDEPSNAGTVG